MAALAVSNFCFASSLSLAAVASFASISFCLASFSATAYTRDITTKHDQAHSYLLGIESFQLSQKTSNLFVLVVGTRLRLTGLPEVLVHLLLHVTKPCIGKQLNSR